MNSKVCPSVIVTSNDRLPEDVGGGRDTLERKSKVVLRSP